MTEVYEKGADARIEQSRHSDEQSHKGQSDLEQAQALQASYVPNTPEEKALVRKLDWRLVPCTWTLYLLSNVDRSNIGNAKVGYDSISIAFAQSELTRIQWHGR